MLICEEARLGAAIDLAEELRLSVVNRELVPGARVSVSIGVAENNEEDDRDSWLKRADAASFAARAGGRNQVCSSNGSVLCKRRFCLD